MVYEKVIAKNLYTELPFMATENILMKEVKEYDGDRQALHEEIRKMSMEAGRRVKEEGKENNLIYLIAENPRFHQSPKDLEDVLDPSKYVGMAPVQTEIFIENHVKPCLDGAKDIRTEEIKV